MDCMYIVFRMYLHRYIYITFFIQPLYQFILLLTMRTNVHKVTINWLLTVLFRHMTNIYYLPSYIYLRSTYYYVIKICTQIFFLIVEVKAKFEGTMYTFYIDIHVFFLALFDFYFIFPVFGLLVRLLCNDFAPSII